jgi:hypothetical protein
VKVTGAEKAPMLKVPGIGMETPPVDCVAEAGNESKTIGGTVKVPSLVRAVHVNVTVARFAAEVPAELPPVICT